MGNKEEIDMGNEIKGVPCTRSAQFGGRVHLISGYSYTLNNRRVHDPVWLYTLCVHNKCLISNTLFFSFMGCFVKFLIRRSEKISVLRLKLNIIYCERRYFRVYKFSRIWQNAPFR